jgi:F-type H+-transporting ATPase subunit delta
MSYDAIGRRYARAIFEIGKEEGQLASVAEQLRDIAGAYGSSDELRTTLENPLVPEDVRASIVDEIAKKSGAGSTAQRALRVITKQRRLRALPDIARHLDRLVDADAKVVRAHVTSASALGESVLGRIRAEIEKSTGSKVVLTHAVDASLLGGVVTRIGDRVVDGSLRTRLLAFRDAALPAS